MLDAARTSPIAHQRLLEAGQEFVEKSGTRLSNKLDSVLGKAEDHVSYVKGIRQAGKEKVEPLFRGALFDASTKQPKPIDAAGVGSYQSVLSTLGKLGPVLVDEASERLTRGGVLTSAQEMRSAPNLPFLHELKTVIDHTMKTMDARDKKSMVAIQNQITDILKRNNPQYEAAVKASRDYHYSSEAFELGMDAITTNMSLSEVKNQLADFKGYDQFFKQGVRSGIEKAMQASPDQIGALKNILTKGKTKELLQEILPKQQFDDLLKVTQAQSDTASYYAKIPYTYRAPQDIGGLMFPLSKGEAISSAASQIRKKLFKGRSQRTAEAASELETGVLDPKMRSNIAKLLNKYMENEASRIARDEMLRRSLFLLPQPIYKQMMPEELTTPGYYR